MFKRSHLKMYAISGLVLGLVITGAGCSGSAGESNNTEDAPAWNETDPADHPETNVENDAEHKEQSEPIEVADFWFEDEVNVLHVVPDAVVDLGLNIRLTNGDIIKAGSSQEWSNQIELTSSAQWVSIDSNGQLHVKEQAPEGEEATITATYNGKEISKQILVLYSLEDSVEAVAGADLPVVTNYTSIAVIVNKERSLPQDYQPEDLVIPDVPFFIEGEDQKKHLRKPAAEALEQLFAAAEEDGIELVAVSGYRSYQRQKTIFEYNVANQGEEHARRFSAMPGTSEHQTGLTMDVSSRQFGNRLEQEFGETEAGKWLAEHSHEHGFIIRYPQGKEEITGYAYEPWHLRYVGKPLAMNIAASGLTMEEYFSQSIPVSGKAE